MRQERKKKSTVLTTDRLFGICLLFTLFLLGVTSCSDDAIKPNTQDTLTFNVAIIGQMNNYQEADNKRVVDWCLSNMDICQKNLTKKVKLNIEWYDEDAPDYDEICASLASREDILTIINMASSEKCARMAYECVQTRKNLILPKESSTELVRQFSNQRFLWTLVETDVTQCEILLTRMVNENARSVSLLACENQYGKTFTDWFAFQAIELGLNIGSIETYTDANDFQNVLSRFPENTHVICAMYSPEEITQLYQVNDEQYRQKNLQFIFTDSSFDYSLFTISNLPFIKGISFYPSPESGFKIAYENRFDMMPFSLSAHLYDAVMLAGFGAAYMAYHDDTDIYDALCEITQSRSGNTQLLCWEGFGMLETFNAIALGGPMNIDIFGATGSLDFDNTIGTCVVNSTFCEWEAGWPEDSDLSYIYVRDYITSNGTNRTAPNLSSWNWNIQLEQFDTGRPVSSHTDCNDQWALIVASSTGWDNYRHQADALRMYQELRNNGFDDSHIILIVNDDLANNEHNPTPGTIVAPDGTNLYDNVIVDYRTTDLSIDDLKNIINGCKTDKLTQVIPPDSTNNVFVFWSGHGLKSGELCWHDNQNGITADIMRDMLTEAAENKRYRKMLWMVEACYSQTVMNGIIGLPDILCFTAANSYEESKADIYDFKYRTYLTNRFSLSILDAYHDDPNISIRDLYYKISLNTIASHVCMINAGNNDNLFLTTFSEFVRCSK